MSSLNTRLLFLSIITTACGGGGGGGGGEGGSAEEPGIFGGGQQQSRLEQIDPKQEFSVSITDKGTSLNLTSDISAYTVELDSCATGFTSTANESNGAITAYVGDVGCLAKLTSLTISGTTYTESSADGFDTWQSGDTATFESTSDASDKIRVGVLAQLSSPIADADSISFAYVEIKEGASQNVGSNVVTQATNLEVSGQSAPGFEIISVAFEGVTETGAGQFVFTFECAETQLYTDILASCDNTLLVDLRYKLIADTYDGSLTLSEAQALFPNDEASIDPFSEVLSAGEAGTINGGFVSKTLDGPDQMHLNPNMILIIEANDKSYRYYNVDVSTIE